MVYPCSLLVVQSPFMVHHLTFSPTTFFNQVYVYLHTTDFTFLNIAYMYVCLLIGVEKSYKIKDFVLFLQIPQVGVEFQQECCEIHIVNRCVLCFYQFPFFPFYFTWNAVSSGSRLGRWWQTNWRHSATQSSSYHSMHLYYPTSGQLQFD